MPETSPPVRRSHLVRNATPAQLFQVVTDFRSYPRLFPEIVSTRVLAIEGKRHRVEFKLQMMLPVRYVLDLTCDAEALMVDWTFVEGDVVSNSEGGWRFVPEAEGTRLDYRVSLTIKAPLPSFMIRKVTDALVSASLPAMFASIERETRARQRAPQSG